MGFLNPTEAIFLSAGVPDPAAPHFIAEGDTAAISSAIAALLYVTLGRRKLVWGGHPAITPMVWSFAEAMDVDYGAWVSLYQSGIFKDEFPAETAKFQNVTITRRVKKDPVASLRLMRQQMINDTNYYAAVFIGGMQGIIDEYELLKASPKEIRFIPIVSTGGAAKVVGDRESSDPILANELDYIGLLHTQLNISPNEKRFATPEDQPADPEARIEQFS